MTQDTRPHVVIVGGGFAGVAAMRELADAPVRVTLVDRHVYNMFQPLMYQVATGGLNAGDVTYFLRSLRARQSNAEFRHGLLTGIRTDERIAEMSDGEHLHYDWLILANGVNTSYFGTPGAYEYAYSMYSRSQALRIRDELFTRLEQAAANQGPDEIKIVIVGGGATGVEMAGALAELRDQALVGAYPEIERGNISITLVHRSGELLKPFAPRLRRYAAKILRKRGVVLRLNTGVAEVKPDGVVTAEGEFIPASQVIWATGVAAHKEVSGWGMPQTHGGRIQVNDDLTVKGFDCIFAAGDIAATDDALAQLAQPAIQGGEHIGEQIVRLLAGKKLAPFKYHDKGTMATVGTNAAVVQLPNGFTLTGPVAWLLWVFVHITSLLGNGNRLSTLTHFFVRYLWALRKRAIPIVGDVRPVRPNGDRAPEKWQTEKAE